MDELTFWLVELEDGDLLQVTGEPGPASGNPVGVRWTQLPRALDLAAECWDWEGAAIVSRFTPAEARDIMWERAKAYREQRLRAPLPVWGVLPEAAIVVDCDLESRLVISGAVQMAMVMQAEGQPYQITFTAHDNSRHTLDGEQVIALGLNVAAAQGLCHAASQAIRHSLDAALADGATPDEIFGIDITTGYPVTQDEQENSDG